MSAGDRRKRLGWTADTLKSVDLRRSYCSLKTQLIFAPHATRHSDQAIASLKKWAIALIPPLALSSCKPLSPQIPDQTITLTVSAAASVQVALAEIDPQFEAAYSGVAIAHNSGGSGILQRQIEQGAPADIFLSASPLQMNALAKKDLLIDASRRDLLSNQLVLIGLADSPLQRFEEIASADVQKLAVGEFRSVPAGDYAEATLTAFNLLPEVLPKLVFFNNVSGVLAAVESGNVSAGIVYKTDADLSERVKILAIAPPNTHPPIRYPIAVLKRSQHPEAAQQYISFLQTPEAAQTFRSFGFTPLTE